jgi:methyl-accepting chemotaxis protein
MKKIFLCLLAVFALSVNVSAAAAETLTPQLCKEKVLAAAKLVEAEGAAAVEKIKDANGEYRFAGGQGYIWIHNLEGTMIMHPIKPQLDGQDLTGTSDPDGMLLFVAMNELVEEHGSGWVPYRWPKPSQPDPSSKVSFVKLVKKDGVNYVLGSGMYDVTPEDIQKLFPDDQVYE